MTINSNMTKFPIEKFKQLKTPFYCYDINLLNKTLSAIKAAADRSDYHVHYAIKANCNPAVLAPICHAGLGIDAVSGGEIETALAAGFKAQDIVFAGVGKSDWEIELALNVGIGRFNVESLVELEVINDIASRLGKVAHVALRANPNIDAHTHKYITTGLTENKFGISLELLDNVIAKASSMSSIILDGLHFHIGSQITINEPFVILSNTINDIIAKYEARGITFKTINVGGGLGVDYDNPEDNPITDFESYFNTFKQHLMLRQGQELHFELGRSVVAQCGTIISRVLYIKEGLTKKFAIIDAGFTELIRPALYQAYHKITPLVCSDKKEKYDVVGPICESSDCFLTDAVMPELKRGDFVVIHSAGAYGEIMSSNYNCRHLNLAFIIDNDNN